MRIPRPLRQPPFAFAVAIAVSVAARWRAAPQAAGGGIGA